MDEQNRPVIPADFFINVHINNGFHINIAQLHRKTADHRRNICRIELGKHHFAAAGIVRYTKAGYIVDQGMIEQIEGDWLDPVTEILEEKLG